MSKAFSLMKIHLFSHLISACLLVGAYSKWLNAAPSSVSILPSIIRILMNGMGTSEDCAAAAALAFRHICDGIVLLLQTWQVFLLFSLLSKTFTLWWVYIYYKTGFLTSLFPDHDHDKRYSSFSIDIGLTSSPFINIALPGCFFTFSLLDFSWYNNPK